MKIHRHAQLAAVIGLFMMASMPVWANAGPAAPSVQYGPQGLPGTASHRVRVMTLNAAHGRKDGPNQLFLGRSSLQSNLQSLADLLKRSRSDVVALQEADGPSRWSGSFDHVGALARQGGFPWRFRGDHAQGWLYRYGTALLSHVPLLTTHSFRFDPSPPTPRKGFVIGEMAWPAVPAVNGESALKVDVVSVHFDYLSTGVRERQLQQLAQILGERDNPRIVLGDFNSDWQAPDSAVRRLAHEAGLRTFEPLAEDQNTYGDRRIDWILISPEFSFDHYGVLPDVVSDHRAVMADISLRSPDAATAGAD